MSKKFNRFFAQIKFGKTAFASVLALSAFAVPAFSADGSVPVQAKRYTFSALVQNTPFKSAIKNSNFRNPTGTASNQIKFLGILAINGTTEYGIYDPIAQRSYWLKLRERDSSGLYIESYDESQKSLTIQSNSSGRLVLALAVQDEKPLAVTGGSYRSVAPIQTTQAQNQQQKTQQPQQNQQRSNRTSRKR